MEQNNNTNGDNKVWNLLVGRGRVLLEVFLLGTGLMVWVTIMFFSPINTVKQDIALIQKDINVIQTNHEQHIESLYKYAAGTKLEIKEQNIKIENNQLNIIRLLERIK